MKACGLVWLLAWSPLVLAASAMVNGDESGVAIHGYDPVAYFVAGEARKGSPDYSYRWHDATWWFENEQHRRSFEERPDAYAPQFGGFCAYAASYGQFADVDPRAWSIVDGKLYLNFSPRVRAIWHPRAAEFIGDADQLWPTMTPDTD